MAKTVLILEDSPTQASIVSNLFKRAGYVPVVAHDEAGAVNELKTRTCDLLVFDVFVGGSNTLEHLDIYRGLAPDAPIAIMTAGRRDDPLAASAALNKARRAKVDFLLPKPFHYDDILQICEDAARLMAQRSGGGGDAPLFV